MNRPKRVTVPAPVARNNEPVMVANYRKRPVTWERGRMLGDPTFHPDPSEGRFGYALGGAWHYRVRLDRKGPSGPIDLVVSSDGVRRIR